MDRDEKPFQSIQVNREYLYEQIAEQLQKAILSGQLGPGARLPPERELAGSMQVNRATVREAVRILEQRGIVERRVGSGTFVTEVPAQVISDSIERYLVFGAGTREELIALREILEPEVAALAAQHATDADLVRMETVLQQLANAYKEEDSEAVARADSDLHVAIAEATQNSLVVAIVNALQYVIEKVVVDTITNQTPSSWFSRADTWMGLHQNFCEAIKARDSKGARKAMLAHFEHTREEFYQTP